MTNLGILEEQAKKIGAKLMINDSGDDGYLMALDYGDNSDGVKLGIAIRVSSAEALEVGAKWMLGQMSTQELAEIADFAADETTELTAGECQQCGCVSLNVGAAPAASGDAISAQTDTLLLSAALRLSILSSQVRDAEVDQTEIQAELTTISNLLGEGAGATCSSRAA